MDPLAGYRPLSEGFAATLANVSAFDGILADAIQIPLHTQFAVVTSDATAAVAGEGAAKRLSSISLNGLTLQERKAAAIIAVSDDLLRFNNAAGLLENSLRTGVAAAVDAIFLTDILAGTTPIASSGNIFVDLRAATDAAGSGSNSRFHLVVGLAVARHLALASTTVGAAAFSEMTATGGVLPGGIVVHVSDSLTILRSWLTRMRLLPTSTPFASVFRRTLRSKWIVRPPKQQPPARPRRQWQRPEKS